MEHDAKTQPPVVAKRDAFYLPDFVWQGFQLSAEHFGDIVMRVRPPTNGDGGGGVSSRGRFALTGYNHLQGGRSICPSRP